jgi:hypothetical protein
MRRMRRIPRVLLAHVELPTEFPLTTGTRHDHLPCYVLRLARKLRGEGGRRILRAILAS